ncbi:hypothetical protein E5288_WYG017964 [Bos mutus]|uniref:Uncharacterized protein n=1 Tax=Bos mutus TaxID=72004 RepID=A0A6B0SAY3_9CETA|nr:hypothetical protein [Bos mutus]
MRTSGTPTSSQDSPGNNPSSSTSSQGSLHKAPKKKGIKSSISRLFRKKEKGRPEHPSKEALGPGCPRTPHAVTDGEPRHVHFVPTLGPLPMPQQQRGPVPADAEVMEPLVSGAKGMNTPSVVL